MDYGHKMTDLRLIKLEKRIHDEYQKAADEVERKLKEHLNKFNELDTIYSGMVDNGKMKKSDYIRWRKSNMIRGEAWKNLRDVLVNDMNNANQIAIGMINKHAVDCYTFNFNYGTYEIENGLRINTGFSLYDHSTVENLMKDKPQIIPKARLDIPRDKRWNKRKMISAITQGILTGDSIPDIARRLRGVSDMNEHAAIRNARTYTTAAQNKGRIDSYQRAKELGIELQKEWMSTPDGRTRDSHVDLDGERVDIDGTFSNGCRYPADPMGEPAEVYNCRCTLVAAIKGQQYHDDRFTRLPEGMTYEDWKAHKLKGDGDSETATHAMVNGIDMSSTWKRREDKFDFAIEDVINAQGFDGLPRVVSVDEFEKYVQEANGGKGFIGQRAYGAPNGEVLSEYKNELYKGKWYVDCSVGGCTEGQGMYCAANYSGKLSSDIIHEMDAYSKGSVRYAYEAMDDKTFYGINEKVYERKTKWYKEQIEKGMPSNEASYIINSHNDEEFAKKYAPDLYSSLFPQSRIETLTLDSSAKIITEKELIKMKSSEPSEQFRKMDNGVYAALKGYDAINAENKGTTGRVSYTVILNRTKVIFKGE